MGAVAPAEEDPLPEEPLLPLPEGLAGPRRDPLPLLELEAFFPFDPLVDDGRFTTAAASISVLAAGAGRPDFPLLDFPLVAVAPGLAAVRGFADPDAPAALGLGRARSVRSATGPLGFFVSVAVASRTGAGGTPTMPFRNRISWVRIRIALETMK